MSTRILVFLCAIALAGACHAADSTPTAPRFTNGDAYVTLSSPQRYSDKGKVELVEVFSYGCVHCARFAPLMQKLVDSLPADVAVHYIPAAFNHAWVPYARAWYAAQQLGVAKATHMAVFKAKFSDHYPMNSLEDLANFYAREGVDRSAFLKAARSPETNRKLAADTRLIQRWGVSGTPTIVVDGKYRSNNVHTYAELADLAHWLVERELAKKSD